MFKNVIPAPPSPVLELTVEFLKDESSEKYNLGVGAYRTNDGDPFILESVREAERRLVTDTKLDHEYLPIDGLKDFTENATALIFGRQHPIFINSKYVAIQTLSGTGAVCISALFLKQCLKKNTVYISAPSWPNHANIFSNCGFGNIKKYSYMDQQKMCLDFEEMINDLLWAEEGAVVVLQASGHNPTGIDPTQLQWNEILNIIRERKLIPVFDAAYLGLASGSVTNDSYAILTAFELGIDCFICQSFAKNFGLYDCRIGNLIVVNNVYQKNKAIHSQLKKIAHFLYRNPPSHGARIITTILNDPIATEKWKREVEIMFNRIAEMRQLLYKHMKAKNVSWDHITSQVGLFAFTGLTEKQVAFVKERYHIYMKHDGRINVCALTTNNLEYIANAFHQALMECS